MADKANTGSELFNRLNKAVKEHGYSFMDDEDAVSQIAEVFRQKRSGLDRAKKERELFNKLKDEAGIKRRVRTAMPAKAKA